MGSRSTLSGGKPCIIVQDLVTAESRQDGVVWQVAPLKLLEIRCAATLVKSKINCGFPIDCLNKKSELFLPTCLADSALSEPAAPLLNTSSPYWNHHSRAGV
jgi:hypothetical protein